MKLDDLTEIAKELFWQNPVDPDDSTMPWTVTGVAHTVCQRHVPEVENLAQLCVEIHRDPRIGGDKFTPDLAPEGDMPQMLTVIVSAGIEQLMLLDTDLKLEDRVRLHEV